MVVVLAGTDTYGRVKKVAGIPIVTKFAMLQFLPLYPLQSMYFLGTGPTKMTGIPLLAHTQSTAIHGIPLAALDRRSVATAYARAVCATLVVLGSLAVFFFGVSYFSNARMDRFATTAMLVFFALLVLGIGGGAITYLLGAADKRERAIRQSCAEVLGIALDPARITADASAELLAYTGEIYKADTTPKVRLACKLIAARAKIAQAKNVEQMEATTDQLLTQLASIHDEISQASVP